MGKSFLVSVECVLNEHAWSSDCSGPFFTAVPEKYLHVRVSHSLLALHTREPGFKCSVMHGYLRALAGSAVVRLESLVRQSLALSGTASGANLVLTAHPRVSLCVSSALVSDRLQKCVPRRRAGLDFIV